MTIPEMIAVLQAAERGEEVEMNNGSGWVPMPNAKNDFESHIATWQYRIKHKPRMVPLEPSDVPPGSVIRNIKEEPRYWYMVMAVHDNVVSITRDAGGLSYAFLKHEWEISRDGGRTWSRCEKSKSV